MFSIILEHWAEVDKWVLVHVRLDPVGNLNLTQALISELKVVGNLDVQSF